MAYTIDLEKVRQNLPKRAEVKLGKIIGKSDDIFYIDVVIEPSIVSTNPVDFEEEWEMLLAWQRQAIGKGLDDLVTGEEGREFRAYLRMASFDFRNLSDEDLNNIIDKDNDKF